uniref:Uncharacterized protein n=1 Tax=Erpetoichthys calabaricus TaxID=27687 RepID=A0A8C4RWU9_ERPCA
MEMKKRISLELRNRNPSEVCSSHGLSEGLPIFCRSLFSINSILHVYVEGKKISGSRHNISRRLSL